MFFNLCQTLIAAYLVWWGWFVRVAPMSRSTEHPSLLVLPHRHCIHQVPWSPMASAGTPVHVQQVQDFLKVALHCPLLSAQNQQSALNKKLSISFLPSISSCSQKNVSCASQLTGNFWSIMQSVHFQILSLRQIHRAWKMGKGVEFTQYAFLSFSLYNIFWRTCVAQWTDLEGQDIRLFT